MRRLDSLHCASLFYLTRLTDAHDFFSAFDEYVGRCEL
jgi:hypothetical protein